ncbi:MAG: hypothetical protein HZB38_01175 [Planctomycetes bacterium]|nr:hypothetical protein [Planctomycetota bacterium]
MALVSGPFSFQRFFISGKLPAHLTEKMLATIEERAFGRGRGLSDDTQVGWIGPRHLLDDDLGGERIALGSFLQLGFRVDRLAAPAGVVKAYVRMEEETLRRASGRDFLSRGERKKAKELAMTRVEQEARDGAFRRMAAYPVLVDLSRQIVLLGTTGAALGDKFANHFSDTFGKSLEPATPDTVARRLFADAANPAALDHLTPMRLVKPPDGYDADRAASAAGIVGDLRFLGRELLTWIWRQSDEDHGGLAVRTGDTLTVMLDRSLKLTCDFGVTGSTTIVCDGPTGLPEARAALRIGKQPARAGMILSGREGEFRFTLDAQRFAITGLVVPEESRQDDWRAKLEERFERIADATVLLDALFELFLTQRVGREWSSEQRRLSAWAAGKTQEKLVGAAAGA